MMSSAAHEHLHLPGNDQIGQMMDKLTASAVSEYIALPMIAVMGDTSSGKSSVLSNIAMTELPSNKDLTTRCPIELIMKRRDEKRAVVSIRWKGEEPEKKFDEVLVNESDWATLSDHITKAQQVILDLRKKEVARDVVVVKVFGPLYIDLTLVDLPGIVRSHGINESATLSRDIDELINEYLKNERCVILAVHPANVDFHNSQIMSDALKVDPNTTRTIPVITKPDLVDPGAETSVVDLLNGKKISFKLGFHMTKGRGQKHLDEGQTIAQAMTEEERYFTKEEPWCGVTDRQLFGIQNLRKKLGDLQVDMIRQTLPAIMKEVESNRAKTGADLAKLGERLVTPTEKRQAFMQHAMKFLENLNITLTGKGKGGKPAHGVPTSAGMHDIFSTFMDKVRTGRLKSVKTMKKGTRVLVSIKDRFGNTKEWSAVVQTLSVESETVMVQLEASSPMCPLWTTGTTGNRGQISFTLNTVRTDPGWLKKEIMQNRTVDLPCFLNVDVFNNIVANFITEDWEPLCFELLEDAIKLLEETTDRVLMSTPTRFSKLAHLLQLKTADAIALTKADAALEIRQHLDLEKTAYTQDHYLFETIAKKRTQRLKAELMQSLVTDQPTVATATIKAIIDGVFDRNQRMSIDDHMAEEMEIMLEAYGKVAFKRIIDKTPQIILKMTRGICEAAERSLQGITDDHVEMVMAEEADHVTRYAATKKQFDEMNKAISIFKEIQLPWLPRDL